LSVDRVGNLAIAEYGAGRLLIVSPSGQLRTEIRVPEQFITAGIFSPDETRIFVTAPEAISPNERGAVYSLANPLAAH
jgi:sugar lactone lactonase YvrE